MAHPNDSFEREIVALHDFFQAWFRGDLPETDETFAQVKRRLADGLEWLHVHEVWLEVE
ncbi:MAG: hypothetical protein ACQEVA_21500 [Myxococcota bacterium]